MSPKHVAPDAFARGRSETLGCSKPRLPHPTRFSWGGTHRILCTRSASRLLASWKISSVTPVTAISRRGL